MSFGFGVGDFIAVFAVASKLRARWIDAPPEYASIKNEVKNVENVLREIGELGTRIDLNTQQRKAVEEACSSCHLVLDKCSLLVDDYSFVVQPKPGTKNRLRRAWKRFSLDPSDVRQCRDQLTALIVELTALQQTVEISLLNGISEDIEDLQISDERRERDAIASWYAPANFADQQNDFSKNRQKGTGGWFLNDDRYTGWSQGSTTGSTLVCPGIPGSGKTMMVAAVVENLHATFEHDPGVVIAYFYCNFNRQSEQELDQIYASLVRQLFQEQSSIPGDIMRNYTRHRDRGTRPSTDELLALLRLLIPGYSKVFILIDALDECNTMHACRDRLLDTLLLVQKQNNVRVMVTTRFIPEILQRFPKSTQIEVRAAREDVEHYISSRMPELDSCVRRNPDLPGRIKSEITALVDGMFLLARLHFETLLDQTNPREVLETLETFTRGENALFAAYNSARQRIDNQGQRKRQLAKKLQEAIAMRPGVARLDHLNDITDEQMIFSVCAGLVVADDAQKVRLVHYTAQEYIQLVRDEWMPDAQRDLTASCIDYLSMEQIGVNVPTWRINYTEHFKKHIFLEYAGTYWGFHATESVEVDLQDRIQKLFRDDAKASFASQITMMTRHGWDKNVCALTGITPLHICAYFGLRYTAKCLIDQGADINARDNRSHNPLIWAAIWGSKPTVELMLASGAGVESADMRRRSALFWAARVGGADIVRTLIAWGANVRTTTKTGQTTLMKAAFKGEGEIVEILLSHGAEVNVQDRQGTTALMRAAEEGSVSVVYALLVHGALVGIADKSGGTAVTRAGFKGRLETVAILDTWAIDNSLIIDEGHVYRALGVR